MLVLHWTVNVNSINRHIQTGLKENFPFFKVTWKVVIESGASASGLRTYIAMFARRKCKSASKWVAHKARKAGYEGISISITHALVFSRLIGTHLIAGPDMKFVKKITGPNFQTKEFYTLKTRKSRLFSPTINSKNTSLSVIWPSFG